MKKFTTSYKNAYNVLSDDGRFITYENIPTWALSYLVNDDPSGLEDEDIELVDEWIKREGLGFCVDVSDEEPSFTYHPAFGLGADVVPATFEKLK